MTKPRKNCNDSSRPVEHQPGWEALLPGSAWQKQAAVFRIHKVDSKNSPSTTSLEKYIEPTLASEEQVAAERAVIAECCRRILGGEPLPSVVRDLDRRGLRTVTGKRWTRNGLRQMLDRPALAGLLTHNGTVVGRLAGAEPVIKAEEWERLSAILAGRPRGRPVADVHILTNTMACGTCGHLMQGTTRASLPPIRTGHPSATCGAARTPTTSAVAAPLPSARSSHRHRNGPATRTAFSTNPIKPRPSSIPGKPDQSQDQPEL